MAHTDWDMQLTGSPSPKRAIAATAAGILPVWARQHSRKLRIMAPYTA